MAVKKDAEQLSDDELAELWSRRLAAGRRAYAAADEALRVLHDRHDPGTRFQLKSGETLELVDNFADSNVAYKPAGVRRFDGKLHRATKRTKSTKKTTKKRGSK